MRSLRSYVGGQWVASSNRATTLFNPSTEEAIAEIPAGEVDWKKMLRYSREKGTASLQALTFTQRGELLQAMAKTLHEGREELISLATANGGNTRGDAKFDIDGASFTLAAYADIGAKLGDTHIMVDGEPEQIGRTARFSAQHVRLPRAGVAVHINAFNFPAWGLAEKAAAALLAGMPVMSKPASATALVAHRMMEMILEQNILPKGALSLISGSSGDLLSHLQGQDVLSFTGSSDTAKILRATEGVVERSVHINVEADSLNAAVLAPDVELGSETFALFLNDVVRDMTQKTGQKCTAIRRIFVPEDKVDDVVAAMSERLADLVVGDPAADSNVRMGPVATETQFKDVRAGIERLAAQTEEGYGGTGEIEGRGSVGGKGYFVGPVLRVTRDAAKCEALHAHEVFGPVSTVAAYSGEASSAAALVRMGEGGLVTSLYSDDRKFFAELVPLIAAFHGRLYLGSEKIAGQSPGPGTVMPALLHGGPGRAGGGEELGGLRGMAFYQQRTALQGDKAILTAITGVK
ncbi:MAG: 3,4-dehydroadipyl-CoA semialdehyde dehydrogenase [Myxococcales bacterium]|nr:3,4-dehydroadipyl-CoA semialdehyde dehydrogenase [Myxococcales bacterium]